MSQPNYELLLDRINSNSESELSPQIIVNEPSSSSFATMRQETGRIISEHLTTVIHLVIIEFVIFIYYLSFANDIELFTWHPVLLSTGWMILVSEAVLILSPDNCLAKCLSFRNRIAMHWILQTVAVLCLTTGFTVVYINKNINSKIHFKTWHGFFGLITMICLIPACLLGILTKYKINLRTFLRLNLNRISHLIVASITFLTGAFTLLLSLYSNWFTKRASYTAQMLCFIVIVLSTAWILRRPVRIVFKSRN